MNDKQLSPVKFDKKEALKNSAILFFMGLLIAGFLMFYMASAGMGRAREGKEPYSAVKFFGYIFFWPSLLELSPAIKKILSLSWYLGVPLSIGFLQEWERVHHENKKNSNKSEQGNPITRP